ncbi:MAG: hypothetical protein IT203_09115 [Fimbriimonadaceae bacterium]|nr:hypothetical protein [Fimbriimonadaceae bacterium]
MRFFPKLIALSALTFAVAIAPAQDLTSFLKEGKYPQKIKPADLGEDMRAMKIVYEKQGGGGDIFSMLMNPLMMMMGSLGQATTGGDTKPEDPQQAAAMAFFDRMGISWTNGSTVKVFDQDFLVTYSVQINLLEATKSKNPPDISKMDLVLTLINTKQIAAITPRLDLTKAEWMKPSPTPPPGAAGGATTAPDMPEDRSQTISNLKQASIAMLMYAGDYDDVIPYVQSTKAAFEVLMPYAKSKDIFKSLNTNGSKILLNMAVAGVNMGSIQNPVETVLFYESKTWPDGTRAVAFCDGHAKMVGEGEWESLKASLNLKLAKSGKPLPATLGSAWDGG